MSEGHHATARSKLNSSVRKRACAISTILRSGGLLIEPSRAPSLPRKPRREHSRKPDEIYARIEALVPGPYLELFARQQRPGWDSWGHEVETGPGQRRWSSDSYPQWTLAVPGKAP